MIRKCSALQLPAFSPSQHVQSFFIANGIGNTCEGDLRKHEQDEQIPRLGVRPSARPRKHSIASHDYFRHCPHLHTLSHFPVYKATPRYRSTHIPYSAKYPGPSQQLNNGAGNISKPTQLQPSPPSRRATRPDLQIRVGRT